jgi:hypothetical protein
MAVVLVGEPEFMTGALYAQDYGLSVRVWSTSSVGHAGTIQAALESMLSANTKLGLLSVNAWTLHIAMAAVTPIEALAERLFGQFTLVASAAWVIQLQEIRT